MPRIEIKWSKNGFWWQLVEEGQVLARSAMVVGDLEECKGQARHVINCFRSPITIEVDSQDS